MVEGARLESVYGATHRRFESCLLRQEKIVQGIYILNYFLFAEKEDSSQVRTLSNLRFVQCIADVIARIAITSKRHPVLLFMV